jgi:hypothetical protein
MRMALIRCIISTSPRLEAGTQERLWAANRLLRHGRTSLAGGCLEGSRISGESTFFSTHLEKLLSRPICFSRFNRKQLGMKGVCIPSCRRVGSRWMTAWRLGDGYAVAAVPNCQRLAAVPPNLFVWGSQGVTQAAWRASRLGMADSHGPYVGPTPINKLLITSLAIN